MVAVAIAMAIARTLCCQLAYRGCKHAEGDQASPPSPRHGLRDRLAYWGGTMRQIGLVCALALSVITGGFRMDWDPDRGPALPAFLRKHPSALAEVALVSPSRPAPPCPWPAEGQHPAAQVCAPSC